MRSLLSTAPALLMAALASGGAAQDVDPEASEVVFAVQGVEKLLFDVDAMIADQESRLAALYERREAEAAGAARQSIDALIDRLTLQLDEMEMLRGTLDGQAAALRDALDVTGAEPEPAEGSAE